MKPPTFLESTRWTAEHWEDGQLIHRLGRVGNELVAEWAGLAWLRASRDGSSYELVADPTIDPFGLEKLKNGAVSALLHQLRGGIALHASSVALNGKAVACTAGSGFGKSSTAAAFCARRGGELLADDMTQLEFSSEGIAVLPSERHHVLTEESCRVLGFQPLSGHTFDEEETKCGVVPARVAEGLVPLAAIIKLEWSDTFRLARIRGHDVLAALLPSVSRFVLDEQEAQLTEFRRLERLVGGVPIYVLARPRDFGRLEATLDLLEAITRGDPVE